MIVWNRKCITEPFNQIIQSIKHPNIHMSLHQQFDMENGTEDEHAWVNLVENSALKTVI